MGMGKEKKDRPGCPPYKKKGLNRIGFASRFSLFVCLIVFYCCCGGGD